MRVSCRSVRWMKIGPDARGLGDLLRRFNLPTVVASERRTNDDTKLGGQGTTAAPALGQPLAPPVPRAGMVAAPTMDLLFDAVGSPSAPGPARPAAPNPSAAQTNEPGRAPAEPRQSVADAEPRRITEQFWRTEVRPNWDLSRTEGRALGLEDVARETAVPAHAAARNDAGMAPGLQLLAALQAGLTTPSDRGVGRVDAKGSAEPKERERARSRTVRSVRPPVATVRRYLLLVSLLAALAVFALTRSCVGL